MIKSFTSKTVALAAVGALALGGGAYAATSSSNAPTPLTSSVFESASEAALAEYPGATIVGLQSRGDGTYEAEVRKADGTAVDVELDKSFKITGTHTGGMGRGGHGGHGGGRGGFGHLDTAALAKTLGVTEAKLQSALQTTRTATFGGRGDQAAAIAKELGASTADVQSVFDAQGGGRGHRGPGGRDDNSELVSALAKKTGKSEAAVTKALEAAHTAREDAQAAALAKELGIDAAKVKSALNAAKPVDRP